MAVTFVRNEPGDYDVLWNGAVIGAIYRQQGEWVLRMPFPHSGVATTLAEAQTLAERYAGEQDRTRTAYARWLAEKPATSFSAKPPPQEEPMTEPSRSVVPPTPEETKWASFVMNEQRHKRPVSPDDRTKAGEIMGRARRASGRVGGGNHKKASPLEVARAIKDVDVKVAEAQGINASREGAPVPPPDAEWQSREDEPAPKTPAVRPATPEEAFQASGVRLIEDLDRALEALRQEHENLANRITETQHRIARMTARRSAILGAIDVVNGAGQ